MPKQSRYLLTIEIDSLTNSIRDRLSGESFETELILITMKDLKGVRKKAGEWHFNWRAELRFDDRKVYKLIKSEQPDVIQGLVSISEQEGYFYLHLAESAPLNYGPLKKHEGVGGNLFAFCCQQSEQNGFEGNIAFQSKTDLIAHYSDKMGAEHIGGHRMIITERAASVLIDKYFKK